MVTLAAPMADHDISDPNVVKVVTDLEGKALYFSRAPIPYSRNQAGSATFRHIGIYGYQRDTLLQLAELEPSPLEMRESLEQLRALENGISIRVLAVEHAWQGVDTIQDLEQIESLLNQTATTRN
jgi:3-deoxy-manno-octulosonate cytidylyltransferase (CMP-KDO synthetase)